MNYPSWIQIGRDPFWRIYFVSNNLETATKVANHFNCQSIENSNLAVQELSRKGILRFYAGKLLCHFMREANDLDSHDKRFKGLLGLD